MNKLYLFLFILPCSLFGQIDSLRNLQYSIKGESLVDVYNQLSAAYTKVNLDSALFFAQKGQELSVKMSYELGQVKALNNLASYYGFKEENGRAIQLVKQAIRIAEENGLSNNQGESYLQLSDLYQNLNHSDSALFVSRLAIQKFVGAEDSLQLSYAYNNLAIIYYRLGDYPLAINNYLKSLAIKEKLGDDYGIASTLANLALVFKNQEDFKKALEFNYRSIPYAERNENYFGLGITYTNIGNLHRKLGQYDSAFYYFDLSEKLAQKVKDDVGLGILKVNRGNVHYSLGNYGEAIKMYQLGLQDFEELGVNKLYILDCYMNLSKSHFGLNNTKEALEYGNRAYTLAVEIGSRQWIKETSFNLYEIFRSNGDSGKSLEYFEISSAYRDSLFNEDKLREMTLLETNYEIEKREAQIELFQYKDQMMQLELEGKSRMTTFLITLLIFLVAVSIIIFYLLKKRSDLKSRLMSSEINELRANLRGLLEYEPEKAGIVQEAINRVLDEPLTTREFDILKLALSDISNPEIAEKENVSVNTVKYHLKKAYAKLGVSDRKEALRFAIRVRSDS